RYEDIHKVVTLNLESAIYLSQICSKVMLQQHSGSIISISSIDAIRGYAGVSVYSATKAALDGFTRSLARELGPRGIRVNSIAPGYFESIMVQGLTPDQLNTIVRRTPLGRLAKAEDIIGVIRFLMSPAAGFITGQTLVVDGGLTC
ncbi:MAG TPA: SDR family oxidoreductase, partial [Blastocatellia bacterium]|nr:SDR family oxidoreductase [Blastocatellia bacterium]